MSEYLESGRDRPDVRGIEVLWLKPGNPENVSVGRHRIADELEGLGADVTIRSITMRTAKRTLRDAHTYDIVVGTTRSGALVGMLATVLTDTPFIVDHIDPIRQFWATAPTWLAAPVHIAESIAFRIADHVTHVTDEDTDRVHRWSESVSETSLGVAYHRFAQPTPKARGTAADALDDLELRQRVAVYIGGLEPLYNINAMIEAFSELDDWSLLVLGNGTRRETVERAATDTDAIHYLGTVEHDVIPGFLAAADVGLNLADEPDTLKVLEYAAAGLPVVHVNGRAEKRYGDLLTYCRADPKSIGNAVQRAAGTNRDTIKSLRDIAHANSWEYVADEYGTAIHEFALPRVRPGTVTPVKQPMKHNE